MGRSGLACCCQQQQRISFSRSLCAGQLLSLQPASSLSLQDYLKCYPGSWPSPPLGLQWLPHSQPALSWLHPLRPRSQPRPGRLWWPLWSLPQLSPSLLPPAPQCSLLLLPLARPAGWLLSGKMQPSFPTHCPLKIDI